ncbi:beta-ketoacyl-ACP synthase III [Streptomyces sp. cg2]|uniref:beta-ketoacyl-ACP synthase III n=1 Tax=Streptomyces sp. cg2 TaxID=3238799 RepID=UPI0034E1E16D
MHMDEKCVPVTSPRAAVLAGLGAALPQRVVDNADISQFIDTDDRWIRSRTGITSRHWVRKGTATGDLAVEAGSAALKSAGSCTVDMLILATSTPNNTMPATAPEVAHRLGLGNIPAFDVSVACAGFIYGLANGAHAIVSGFVDRALVIGADIWSNRLDYADRATAILFGDGAGAAVLRSGSEAENGVFREFDLGSDGSLKDLAVLADGGSRQRASEYAPRHGEDCLAMQGKGIFVHAVNRMSESSRDLLKKVGWEAEDVGWVVAHQANARILNTVADVLGVDRERLIIHLDRVGNTSAASIPLALTDAASSGRLASGDRVLLTAFGGGLSWGSAVVRWPDIEVSPVVVARDL